MIKLVVLLAAATTLAFFSQQYTEQCVKTGMKYRRSNDLAYIMLVVMLIFYTGLRTDYNDTWNYINGFNNAPGIKEFLANPDNLNPFTNPLFYAFQSLLKEVTSNGYVLIFLSSLFTQLCFVWFIKKYSPSFTFGIFLYFTLGTFNVTMAALKQVLAMSVLLIAFSYLEKRKLIRYYLLVFIAMLLHTYAIAFVILPLLRFTPWRLFTFAFVGLLVLLMLNFEVTITAFMDQANELGKTLENYEVFHEHGMNLFRVGVYAVLPFISFVFRKRLFWEKNKTTNTLIHMSIVSLAFMIMGTQGGANMFGRMAHYFEIGIICMLPFTLEKIFEKRSYYLVSTVAVGCFLIFFGYANGRF